MCVQEGLILQSHGQDKCGQQMDDVRETGKLITPEGKEMEFLRCKVMPSVLRLVLEGMHGTAHTHTHRKRPLTKRKTK